MLFIKSSICHMLMRRACLDWKNWIHTRILSVFSTLSSELQHFHSDSTPLLSNKTLMQSVSRWPVESCVMCVKRSWSWTWFNSWSSITFGIAFLILIYQTAAHDLKKQKCACEQAMTKLFLFKYESSFIKTQPKRDFSPLFYCPVLGSGGREKNMCT